MKKISFVAVLALAGALVVPAALAQDTTTQPAQAPAAEQSAQPAQAPAADQSAQPAQAPAMQDQTAQPAQAPAAEQSAQPAQAEQGAAAAGAADLSNQTGFTGCLTGTEDNYVLRDEKTGMLFRLHSDKDIGEHVNHRVMVKGRIDDQQREHQAQSPAEQKSQAAAGAQIPKHGINVEDIQDAGACTSQK